MQVVPIRHLAEGMVVAKPVANEKGAVLLAQGTTLTEALIRRLERMDVTKVTVEGHPVDLPDSGPAKTPEERLAELDKAFSRLEDDALMMAIKAIYVEYVKNPPEKPPPTQEIQLDAGGADAAPGKAQ